MFLEFIFYTGAKQHATAYSYNTMNKILHKLFMYISTSAYIYISTYIHIYDSSSFVKVPPSSSHPFRDLNDGFSKF